MLPLGLFIVKPILTQVLGCSIVSTTGKTHHLSLSSQNRSFHPMNPINSTSFLTSWETVGITQCLTRSATNLRLCRLCSRLCRFHRIILLSLRCMELRLIPSYLVIITLFRSSLITEIKETILVKPGILHNVDLP